jgi:hypothetical protein
MTIEYILSHVYKHHTTLLNPNFLVGGADASLLRPLFLPPDYTTTVAFVFSLRQGAVSFSISLEATGRHGHDGSPCLSARHDTVKEP